jgi:hypothetical protein
LCIQRFITFFSYTPTRITGRISLSKIAEIINHYRYCSASSIKVITFYGLSIAAQGCTANFAVGAVFGPYDYCLSVDRSAFILGFAWAGTVVIATWPVLLRVQRLLFGRRALAVLVMTLLLFCCLLFRLRCWSIAWWITAVRSFRPLQR